MSKFGALRIGRRNPEEQESGVRVVGIWRDVTRDRRQGCFWPMLPQPCLALGDPLHAPTRGAEMPTRPSKALALAPLARCREVSWLVRAIAGVASEAAAISAADRSLSLVI